ncbi:MAG: HAD-IB family hydrolase [Acidimicrobiales bacterium]
MIREALAGKRIVISGATGFLGTALVERLLRQVPGCTLGVLVRPGRRGAADRVRREVLKNDAFDRLRAELGDGFAATVDGRLVAIAGDVGVDGLGLDEEGRQFLAGADVFIHSAAAVSFDSPLDQAVEINLLGPTRVVEVMKQLCPTAHLVAVSTSYVAGTRRGKAYETTLDQTPYAPDVDWRAEVAAARRTRADLDSASRTPPMLAELHKRARQELGGAGVPLLAERTERLRQEWVKDGLVDAGVARASSLGWPDAYPYTKALGERALLEHRGEVAVSIVRPSIIESAVAEPRPGWIRGFRMADPIIISYARGLLKEFPGIPEGIVDVIPVDLVVAAIIDVAATGPDPAGPSVYQVASGSRNPLRYGQLVDHVRSFFTATPIHDADGQPIEVPEWSFPGRGRVQAQLKRAERLLSAGERVLQALPLRGPQADLAARFEERRDQVERALEYVELYGHYTETEAIFQVDRLLALHRSLPEEDQRDFGCDPAIVDWASYIDGTYLPAVVDHARVKMTPGRKTGLTREERGRKAILSPDRHVAAFDLENTLIASNVVDSYSWLATRRLDGRDRVRFVAKTLRQGPGLLKLDRKDRGDFLRHFYRRYDGAPVAAVEADVWDMWAEHLMNNAFPAALRRVRRHRELGHRTILITGALDMLVEPIKPLFDVVVAARMHQVGGRYTGELVEAPCTGEARALAIREYCAVEGLELEQCVAYADSASDLPMLEVVGHPVAVNAEAKLAAIARKRGWHTEHWQRDAGASRTTPISRRASFLLPGQRKAGV